MVLHSNARPDLPSGLSDEMSRLRNLASHWQSLADKRGRDLKGKGKGKDTKGKGKDGKEGKARGKYNNDDGSRRYERERSPRARNRF